MTSISTEDSAWTSDVSAICSIGSNWSYVMQQNRTADFANSTAGCDFMHQHRFCKWWHALSCFYRETWIHDKYKWLISNDEGVSYRRRLELASVPCGGTVNYSIFQGGAVQVDVGRIRIVKRHPPPPHPRDTPRGRLWITYQNQKRDLEHWVSGCSRSLKLSPFDRPYKTFYWSTIVTIGLYCTVFELFDVE